MASHRPERLALVQARASTAVPAARPRAKGKFLVARGEKLYVRGVTYGTFKPDPAGNEYDPQAVERDFADIASAGFNAVRTYTVPPRWLLDAAARHGLYVMVGLPWEQHVTFLDDRRRARSIEERVRASVSACAGHPAILCYAIGNEIPASVVRWHGSRRIERFLRRLARAVREADPGALVTYVNYPSTEYLDLSFADFLCFNVYLESQSRLDSYLARLQNLAGDRPLVLAELGLDSRRNGADLQANMLAGQIECCFDAGCAGLFVFAWTDEWYRGGHDIEDWDFGLTDRAREPKPALAAVSAAFSQAPFGRVEHWPRISVVVCTHNGERTLRECLGGLSQLDFPDFEVIVVDDGSSDTSASIAAEFPCLVISTENRGLGAARNVGLEAATGEIVAYIDDDAWPDPQWLRYLARAFERSVHAGIGGPNIPPPDDGPVAHCVANAPGGPIHVLVSDRVAEHVPGCNMAFRRQALEAINGFDARFGAAGDDVDVCWRVQERGWSVGFEPAAVVWHRRRSSVRAYWRQQRAYGRAEALLERKWPQKYNGFGHVTWAGRLYGNGRRHLLGRRSRIHYGRWGTGLFQRVYQPPPTSLHTLPLMPEWPLVVAALAGIAAFGVLWNPLYLAGMVAAVLTALVLLEAGVSAARARLPAHGRSGRTRFKQRLLLASMYLLQPIARLSGRLGSGLTPWRMRGRKEWAVPRPRSVAVWSERWASASDRIGILEEGVRGDGTPIVPGEAFDRWDLEARGGMLGAARLRMAIEEHGSGRQLVRFRIRPRLTRAATLLSLVVVAVAASAGADGAWTAFAMLAAVGGAFVMRALAEASMSTAALLRGVGRQHDLAEHALAADLARRVHGQVVEHAGEPA